MSLDRMSLMTEGYQRRDQICSIPFQGDRANDLLLLAKCVFQLIPPSEHLLLIRGTAEVELRVPNMKVGTC